MWFPFLDGFSKHSGTQGADGYAFVHPARAVCAANDSVDHLRSAVGSDRSGHTIVMATGEPPTAAPIVSGIAVAIGPSDPY